MNSHQKQRLLGFPFWITAALLFTLVAWTGNPGDGGKPPHTALRDTVPGGQKDLDRELRQLDAARSQLQALSQKDWDRMEQQLKASLAKIDLDKIRMQTMEALQKVDIEKITRDVQASLQQIDFDKIQKDLEKALREAPDKTDREKIREELEKARQAVKEELQNEDWRKELEEAKKIDLKALDAELAKAKEEIQNARSGLDLEKLHLKDELKKGFKDIDSARAELKGYQDMIYGMEKDGLLDTRKDYSIEYKNGALWINQQKQDPEVLNKYRKYFRKDPTTIRKEQGDIHIDIK